MTMENQRFADLSTTKRKIQLAMLVFRGDGRHDMMGYLLKTHHVLAVFHTISTPQCRRREREGELERRRLEPTKMGEYCRCFSCLEEEFSGSREDSFQGNIPEFISFLVGVSKTTSVALGRSIKVFRTQLQAISNLNILNIPQL